MKRKICSLDIITEELLPLPGSTRERWCAFLGKDRKLRLSVEGILKNRTKRDFYFQWRYLNENKGVFALLYKLKFIIGSINFYFFPKDEFSVIAKAYGEHLPELYEILHDVFFRKEPKYKSNWSELYVGVPKKIDSMTMGDLIHHLKTLRGIRIMRDEKRKM